MPPIVPIHETLVDCALTLNAAVDNASESLGQDKPPKDVITILCHQVNLVCLALHREARAFEELHNSCNKEHVGQSTSDAEYQRGYKAGFDRGVSETLACEEYTRRINS